VLQAVWTDGSIVVAVGQRSLIRSTDAGLSWTVAREVPAGSTGTLSGVWGRGETVYAVGLWQGLLRSADRGASWEHLEVPDFYATSIAGDAAVLYAANGTQLRRSEDGGESWQWMQATVATPLMHAVWVDRTTTLVLAVGNEGTVMRLDRPGLPMVAGTWTLTAGEGQPRPLRTVWGEGGTLLAIGEGYLRRSTTDGASWQPQPTPFPSLVQDAWGASFAVVAVGADGTIRRSIDRGQSWLTGGSSSAALHAVGGTGHALAAVGDNGTILRSADVGHTWQPVASPTIHHLYGVWGNGAELVAVGRCGVVLRSTDYARTWTQIDHRLTGACLYGVWGEGRTVVAVGDGGTMLRSTDAGASWQRVQSGTTRTLWAVAGHGETMVAVGARGTILVSEDAGLTWRAEPPISDHRLRAVWLAHDRTLTVVGDGGVIVRATR
jgi:photosystem II stability/assembly factor-like uncharacterized protein